MHLNQRHVHSDNHEYDNQTPENPIRNSAN